MEELSRYWTLIRLKPSGGYRDHPLSQSYAYLQQNFPNVLQEANYERLLQIQLVQRFQAGDAVAALCLRCYISHAILHECQALVRQFGEYYNLDETELLSCVLNDEGLTLVGAFKPLAYEILETYNSRVSALNTWTSRLVRQNSDLKQCLKEHGLLLITDWALLNDTKPRQLQRILVEYFDEAAAVAERAAWVHEAYRSIYLPDRTSQRGGTCTDPTLEQLTRMANYVGGKFNQTMTPEAVMVQLQGSAKRLRQYRLRDRPNSLQQLERNAGDEYDYETTDFLNAYRHQLLQCLDRSVEAVVDARTQGSVRRVRATTAEKFLRALTLYYCEGVPQSRIAERLQMRGQDAIAKLLKLTQLRSQIKLHMFTCLQTYIQTVVDAGDDPNKLLAIDTALNEQLDQVIQQDQDWGYTVTAHLQPQGSLLSQRICAHLNHRLH